MANYRIVRIANFSYSSEVRDALFRACPEIDQLSYAEQQHRLFASGAVYGDAFARAMRSLGHEAHDIIYDYEPMQKKWAEERGLAFREEQWSLDITLGQLAALKPDVVYFQDIWSMPLEVRLTLKDKFPGIKVVAIYKGFPGHEDKLQGADAVFAGTPAITRHFREAGLNAHLVYHAFDDRILTWLDARRDKSAPETDFSFVGSSGYGESWEITHLVRYWSLVEMMMNTSLEAWLYEGLRSSAAAAESAAGGHPPDSRSGLGRAGRRILNQLPYPALERLAAVGVKLGPRWGYPFSALCQEAIETDERKMTMKEWQRIRFSASPSNNRRVPRASLKALFPDRAHPAVFGLDMYRVLQNSRVSLNIHTNCTERYVGNIRMFEVTGVGSCLLTDSGMNLSDLFELDREVVAYSSVPEAIEKAAYLREHDDERRKIAGAGQRRTLRDHTVLNRVREIDHEIQKWL